MSSTLELNCLVFSDDINRIFSVEILRTESVGALKKAIKDKNKDTFQHVDADTLALWKVSFPVTTRLPEDLGNHEFVDKESLSPVEELSAVFSEPPILKYLHIVVKAPPTVIHTDPPSSTLQLVCYVRGDDYMRTFEVEIEMGEPVAAFRNAIKEKMGPDFDHIYANSLGLWNVNIPLDENLKETVDKLGLVDEKLLFPLLLLSDVFPQQPADGHLHIVVKDLPITIPRKRMLSEPPENVFGRLKRAKIVTNEPSDIGKSEKYQSLQGDPSERILDDRPKPDDEIPPISLLYEGFGHFLDIMDGHKNVPGLADVDVQELRMKVDVLASEMTGYFSKEDERRGAALPCLNSIFSARCGINVPRPYISTFGFINIDSHNLNVMILGAMIVVFKNRLTGISSLPQVELECYAARLAATRMDEELYLRSRVPFVGLTIVGCNITFYAIIAIDHRFRIVSLTPGLSCIPSASDGRDRALLYSAFTAALVLQARIIQDSKRLLNNPPASGGDHFSFEIQSFFPGRQPYRRLYVAETPDKQRILIKFARRYPIELHEYCANLGHAPPILAFEKLPGGWCATAMEYIESGLPIADPNLPPAHRDCWTAALLRLMDDFHSKDFVPGDSVTLVDFDWSVKDEEAKLNNELFG